MYPDSFTSLRLAKRHQPDNTDACNCSASLSSDDILNGNSERYNITPFRWAGPELCPESTILTSVWSNRALSWLAISSQSAVKSLEFLRLTKLAVLTASLRTSWRVSVILLTTDAFLLLMLWPLPISVRFTRATNSKVISGHWLCTASATYRYGHPMIVRLIWNKVNKVKKKSSTIQEASGETDGFEMDVTEQVEGVEAWVGAN